MSSFEVSFTNSGLDTTVLNVAMGLDGPYLKEENVTLFLFSRKCPDEPASPRTE